ncbi:MAG: hypothetical protein WCA10_00160 [Terracidiphilus sp.]
MRKAILACLVLLMGSALLAQQALDNQSVIKLVKAGLSEDLIVTTINSSPGTYDTSANGLIALKKAGASDKVIAAIVIKASGAATGAAAVPAPNSPSGVTVGGAPMAGSATPGALVMGALPAGVDSVGVYYLDSTANAWQEVPAEVVNFKTSGALKHYASVGVVKEDMNALIGGNRSRTILKMPASFIFYVPEGRSPGEYQLLRLHVNADSRQFRASTGGVVHESGGAMRDTVDYTSKKIAPRVYQIVLGEEVGKGEFGFLPPSDTVSENNIASSGKMYTFALVP